MKQLIWKAIKSTFMLYDFTMSDYKSNTLEEMRYKHDVINTVQMGTFVVFIVILFGITGLILVNIR
jgi:hypothetical protein